MKPFSFKILLLLGSVSLTGCSTIHLNNLSEKYHFKKNTPNGVAALSVRCNLGNQKTNIYFSQKDNVSDTSRVKYDTSFGCNSPTQPLSSPELKLVQLPAGTYSIVNWAQIQDYKFFIDKKTSLTFNPITFRIYPGQVTYIGELQLMAGPEKSYQMQLINNAKVDLPNIRNNLPLIAKQDIHVKLGVISPKKINYSGN